MRRKFSKKIFIIGIVLILAGIGLTTIASFFHHEESVICKFEKAIKKQNLSKVADCVDEKSAQGILATKKYFNENGNEGIEQYVYSLIGVDYAKLDTFCIYQGKERIIDENNKIVPCNFFYEKDGKIAVLYKELFLVNENGTYYINMQ